MATVTALDTEGSYDDLPESDVNTVLQVPLLWSPPTTAEPTLRQQPPTRSAGRHRANAATTVVAGRTAGQRRPFAPWSRHPLASTARVGLVSAVLVLAGFAAALLALAVWLP